MINQLLFLQIVSSFSIIEKVADKVLDMEVLQTFQKIIKCRDGAVREAVKETDLLKKWEDCHYNADEMRRNIKRAARRDASETVLT